MSIGNDTSLAVAWAIFFFLKQDSNGIVKFLLIGLMELGWIPENPKKIRYRST